MRGHPCGRSPRLGRPLWLLLRRRETSLLWRRCRHQTVGVSRKQCPALRAQTLAFGQLQHEDGHHWGILPQTRAGRARHTPQPNRRLNAGRIRLASAPKSYLPPTYSALIETDRRRTANRRKPLNPDKQEPTAERSLSALRRSFRFQDTQGESSTSELGRITALACAVPIQLISANHREAILWLNGRRPIEEGMG